MRYLIIDGNSIIFRAFYGIKLLNAKDGHFTNAIYGFMNILLNLDEKYCPDSIIVAFDVHEPTFRHKMYEGYKAGRKNAPNELLEQFEPLKKLLKAYGCHIIECPGFEADDILGTVSRKISESDFCYIATGDRDSLQLIKENVTVLLTSTKMGKTQTIEYDLTQLYNDYGVSPKQMIDIKALQGDSSDNIPGVAGIGPKTAGELIKQYQNIEYIYDNINDIEVTAGVRNKLINGKESAFFSKQLGTISFNAPISEIECFSLRDRDNAQLLTELSKHEMFKLISKLKLSNDISKSLKENSAVSVDQKINFISYKSCVINEFIKDATEVYVLADISNERIEKLALINFGKILLCDDESICAEIIENVFNNNIKIYSDDSKSIYKFCLKNKIKTGKIDFDIRLAAYLLDVNTSDYSIPALSLSYNVKSLPPEFLDEESKLFYENNKDFCENAALFEVLSLRLKSIIEEREQTNLLTEIEIPLSEVLAAMELEGMMVDTNGIKEFSSFLEVEIKNAEEKIFEAAGESFNINSPKQLGVILFEKMGIPPKKKTKTGYSTNAEVLESLAEDYPIVSNILQYRTYTKLKSTYCDGLLKSVDNDNRVRCTFNQTETRTGRLSSTEPNLQNIPVRTQIGKEMRKFFIAKKGYKIVDADYSQIELRVLAALSNDKNMINAFNSNTDIHSVTASKVFNVPINEVTPELRSKAKAVNFGIVYGIGAFSLAKDINSTRAQADMFIKAYLSLYSQVDEYMNNCIDLAKINNYSETFFKRRRYLPELSSSNGMIRSFGERVARNMPIQGTAADIIKIAMIKVYYRLKNEYPNAKLIMQVHDELMAEVPDAEAENVADIIKEEMENAVSMSVKFIADTAIGDSWYESKQ